MKRCALAYVVQLDLPGGPIKIGSSTMPRNRFKHFEASTPCDMRFVGVTYHGDQREAEMLAATSDRTIRGEWRYPTQALYRLLAKYHAAGEWFTPVDDHRAHFDKTDVKARVRALVPGNTLPISPGSLGYFWAKDMLKVLTPADPTLHLDWAGFAPAAPTLHWPASQQAAA